MTNFTTDSNAVSDEKLKDTLRKVQALIAKADSTSFPEEADALRAKADALLTKYRIDEVQLQMSSGQWSSEPNLPVWEKWSLCEYGTEYSNHYYHIARACALHLDCMVATMYEDGKLVVHVCGYPSELRMAEALYTTAILAFSTRLEPKVDPNLSDAENCYNLRRAGMEGQRIAMLVFGRDEKSMRIKARRLFKEEAERRGDEEAQDLLGRGNSVKNYREDYANGFALEIGRRLARMRADRGQDSGALVLADRGDRVKQEFYDKYPQLNPDRQRVSYSDPREGCPRCEAAKSGYCREHAYLRPSAGRAGRATNMRAYEAGQSSAQSVDLGRPGTGRVQNTGGPKGEIR